ncbi:Hpt domain-containing protein [Saccharospirillum sp. HFRX-1]|uniref:Hpt domain-containing protein n=1 Tax=unclassified Saccharospirillum TaxID=2633430 RepID=UPI00370FD47C
MVERRDYIALEWVRGEIDKTLRTATDALQSHLDTPDPAALQTSAAALHQISGSLQMVECHSASLLAEELEHLNQALLDDEVESTSDAVQRLLDASAQLPVYLDRLAQGQDDSRALILPAVNQLRAARGEDELSEAALFHPDLDAANVTSDHSGIELFRQNNVLQLVRKLRQMYELALLGWLRELDVEANLSYLGKAVSRLALLTEKTPVAALWRISDVFTSALASGRLARSAAVVELLRQLDTELKHLLENPVEVVGLPPDDDLLKELLYQLAQADSEQSASAAAPSADAEPSAEAEPAPEPTATAPAAAQTANENRPSGLSPAQDAIIQDASAGLERVKDALAEFAQSRWDTATLATIPAEMGSLRSDLDEVPLPEADEVLRCIDGYISQQLMVDDEVPEATDMDALADAIIGVQYYLEQLAREGAADVGLLENAAEAITSLGFPADLQAATGSDLDEDLDGVFSAMEADDDFSSVLDDLDGFNAASEHEEPDALTSLEMDAGDVRGRADDKDSSEDDSDEDAEALDIDGIDSWLAEAESSFATDPALDDIDGDDSDDETAADEAALEQMGSGPLDATAEAESEPLDAETETEGSNYDAADFDNLLSEDGDDSGDDDSSLDRVDELDEAGVANLLNDDGEDLDDLADLDALLDNDDDDEDAISADELDEIAALAAAALDDEDEDEELDLSEAIDNAFEVDDEELALEDLPLTDLELANLGNSDDDLSSIDTPDPSLTDLDPRDLEPTDLDPSDLDGLALERAIDADLVAADIVDIFIEEVGEVLDTLAEHYPRYRDQADDSEALGELRGAFYTLKSSGELAGAEVIGETAWAVENMLSRLIDGTISRSDDLLQVLEGVIDELPALVAAYQQRQTPDARRADDLADKAHLLARGQPVDWNASGDDAEPDVDENDQPAESDDELLAVFQQELDEHLEFVEHFLEEADTDQPVPERLHRALHTIKGSARMASVDAVADLVLPLEQRVRELHEQRQPLNAQMIELLNEGVRRLRAAADGRSEPDDLDFIDRVVRASGPATELEAEFDAEAATDAEAPAEPPTTDLNSLLMSKGVDTLLEAPRTFQQWQTDGEPGEAVATLGHELNRLSEQGRDLNLPPVVEMSRGLALMIEMALAGEVEPDDDFFALAQRGQEKLIEQLDQLAAGQDVSVDSDFVTQLRRYRADADPLNQPPQRLTPMDTMIRHDLIPEAGDQPPADAGAATPDLSEAEEVFRVSGDSELVDIFLEEARDLVDSMQTALEQWEADTTNTLAVEGLQRDLHTLKGGASLAEIEPVSELAHEMESMYEGLSQGKLQPSKRLLGLMQRSQDQLATMIQQITTSRSCRSAKSLMETIRQHSKATPSRTKPKSKPTTKKPTTAPLAEADVSAHTAVSVAPGVTGSADEVDLDILDIFVDEAAELLVEIEQLLEAWQADTSHAEAPAELMRVLHTLKGGAHLAKLKRLADLCHEFETEVAQAEADPTQLNDAFFAAMLARQDRLVQGVDSMRTLLSRDDSPHDFGPSVMPQAAETSPRLDTTSDVAAAPATRAPSQDSIKVNADLLERLVNLAGESSIVRARLEQEVSDFQFTLTDMDATLERLREQVRHLDMETEAQVLFRQERAIDKGDADFDPLEMDRYSHIQQLSRSLLEASSDLSDLKDTLVDKSRDTETLLQQQGRLHSELQEGLMQTRLVPFSRLVPRLRRMVRQLSSELEKEVEFSVANAEGEVDRTVLERMISPLEHMLRNAVDHGIETPQQRRDAGKAAQGQIELSLAREGADVVLRLSDDGAGLDVERIRQRAEQMGLISKDTALDDHAIIQQILEPGFSTAEALTQVSGRGVGMDVVHAEVKQLGGSMSIAGRPGEGSQFTIRLPFTVSVNRALMVRIGNDFYALPLSTIEGIVRVPAQQLDAMAHGEQSGFDYAGTRYQTLYLGALLDAGQIAELSADSTAVPLILVPGSDSTQPVALYVDQLLGSREIVVKTLGPQFSALAGVSGATILGDGSVVVILDPAALLRHRPVDASQLAPLLRRSAKNTTPTSAGQTLNILVVDDSVTVRKVTSRLLERQGWHVWLAKDGLEAIQLLQEQPVDVMLLDIEMPNMDGFEVAQQVRHDERLHKLPIIMITSRTGAKHRQRALSIGVNEYLGKPFQEDVLLDCIARLCAPVTRDDD